MSFSAARAYLPPALRDIVAQVPARIQASTQEIRLRAGGPVVLSTPAGDLLVTKTGQVTELSGGGLLVCDRQQLDDCFQRLCEYSVPYPPAGDPGRLCQHPQRLPRRAGGQPGGGGRADPFHAADYLPVHPHCAPPRWMRLGAGGGTRPGDEPAQCASRRRALQRKDQPSA